jgi:hypothetical protein
MITAPSPVIDAPTFGTWAQRQRLSGRLPRIVVVGSVGKSTVARLVDDIAQSCGLRTALRVDGAVEEVGRRRGSDASAWDRALGRLRTGALDLAIEEAHWHDIPALRLSSDTIGMLVVSTICPDREVCRLDETRAAISMLRSIITSLPPEVVSIVDADDVAFSLLSEFDSRPVAVAALRPEQPAFRRFFAEGGPGAWLEDGSMMVGRLGHEHVVGQVGRFPPHSGRVVPLPDP